MSSSPTPDQAGSSTNSIEIFIDADGKVTFTDLPDELKKVAETLTDFQTQASDWCDLFPKQ